MPLKSGSLGLIISIPQDLHHGISMGQWFTNICDNTGYVINSPKIGRARNPKHIKQLCYCPGC
jgi:hypothetical protein